MLTVRQKRRIKAERPRASSAYVVEKKGEKRVRLVSKRERERKCARRAQRRARKEQR